MKKTSLICLLLSLVGCAHAASAEPTTAESAGVKLLEVAEHAARAGDTLRTQQYLLAALASGVDDPRIMPWLLRSYVADGQYRSAIHQARERLSVRADDLPLRLLLASLYRATGLDASALEQYQEVLAREPNQARAHLELAMMLHENGSDVASAEQHFQAYLRLEPKGHDAAAARARLLRVVP